MAKQEIDVKIISRESIKPSSPTPLHLKTFNLSFFDQFFSSNLYTYFLAFYPSVDNYDRRVRDLKSSLSETLTRFYHLAGRIIENELLIDCTDDGADFIEAKVSCNLSDIIKKPDLDLLFRLLLPTEIASLQGAGAISLIQTNLFECGGLAVCVSVSHQVADACTLGLFIKEWATRARGAGDLVAPDITALASRFPAVSGTPLPKKILFDQTKSYKTRRYVFDSKIINALKTKATSAGLQRPSRVEVVTGHIWTSTIKIGLRNNTRTRSHVLIQPMNLRKRIDPPLSENSFGNVLGSSFALARESDDKATEFESLIGALRRGLQRAIEWYGPKNANIFDRIESFKGNNTSISPIDGVGIVVTSACRFGFYDISDFGWGKPVWFSVGTIADNNMSIVVLTDTKDGDGIEAWITLEEHVMDLLEADQDFLKFACVNPSIDLGCVSKSFI